MFQTSTSVLQTIQLAHLVTVQIQLATSRVHVRLVMNR